MAENGVTNDNYMAQKPLEVLTCTGNYRTLSMQQLDLGRTSKSIALQGRSKRVSTTTKKTARFEQRSTPEVRDLIERAAELSGRSVSDFIISSAEAAAREAIRTYQVIQMTTAGTADFVQAFLNPPSSSERMEVEARRYLELVDRE